MFGTTDINRELQTRDQKGSGLIRSRAQENPENGKGSCWRPNTEATGLRAFGCRDETAGQFPKLKELTHSNFSAKGETHHLHPGHRKPLELLSESASVQIHLSVVIREITG